MGILWIKEKFKYDGQFGLSQEDLTRAFEIFVDDPSVEDPVSVKDFLATQGIAKGIPHPNSSAWCRDVSVRAGSNHGLFDAVAKYSNGPISKEEQDKIAYVNPLDRPAILEGSRIAEQEPCVRDRNGFAYETAANTPFDPPPTKEVSRLQLVFKKSFDNVPDWWFSLGDCINNAAIYIGHSLNKTFPARSVLFRPLAFTEQLNERDYSFVDVRFMLDIKQGYRKVGLYENLDPLYLDEQFSGSWSPIGAPIQMTESSVLENYRRPINWDREFANMGLIYRPVGEGGRKEFRALDGTRMANPQWLSSLGANKEVIDEVQKDPKPNYLVRGDHSLADFTPIAGHIG